MGTETRTTLYRNTGKTNQKFEDTSSKEKKQCSAQRILQHFGDVSSCLVLIGKVPRGDLIHHHLICCDVF